MKRWARRLRGRLSRGWIDLHRRSSADGPTAVVGYFHGAFGLGEAARLLADQLELGEESVLRIPLTRDFPLRMDPDLCTRTVKDGRARRAIVVANPDSLDDVWIQLATGDVLRAPDRIAYWFWEQTHVPEVWRRAARAFSQVWAPTGFVTRSLSAALDVPVVHVPVDWTVLARRLQEIPRTRPGPLTVVVQYDRTSSFWRKRPDMAWDVFCTARDLLGWSADRLRFRLHVNTYGQPSAPLETGWLARLTQDESSGLVEGPRPRAQQLGDLSRAHVLLSTSCAEGLGLPLMEAAVLGLLVLAPTFSGIAADEPERFVALPYTVDTPRLEPHFVYRATGQWAYVDVPRAATVLAEVLQRLDQGEATESIIGAMKAPATASSRLLDVR